VLEACLTVLLARYVAVRLHQVHCIHASTNEWLVDAV
jgi:hypothetical protein